jgi:RND family efflux transporter MFP subunit
MAEPDLSRLKISREQQAAPRMRARRMRWVVVLAVVIAAVLAAMRFANRQFEVEAVTVSTAFPYQAVTLLNAAGYVVAQRKAAVASKATGRLEWLGVVEGSVVRQDDVIARLESKDVRASADQAQANASVAQANIVQADAELRDAEAAVKRSRDLVTKKFLSQSALDSAEARYNKAKAGVASARAQYSAAQASARVAQVAVEQTLVRAPFDGVVLTKTANVGDVITPFSSALDTKGAVVTMADMSTLEIEADVSEANLSKIRVGQPCEIQLDAFPELRFRGQVNRLVPTIDRAKASVMTKVRFVDRDARVLPEMSAKVAFLSQEVREDQRKPLTVVNPEAVVTRAGRSVVFLIADQKVKETEVRTGERLGETVVVSELKPGDKVVLKPSEKLRDGAQIKLAQKS